MNTLTKPCAYNLDPVESAATSDDAKPTHPGSVVPFFQSIDNRTRQNPERHGTAVSVINSFHEATTTAGERA